MERNDVHGAGEKWFLRAKKGDFYGLGAEFSVDPVIARLLVNRGVDTPAGFEKYLHGSLSDLYDPALLADAEKAADLVDEALRGGRKIVIASDFDADGIFSGQLLLEAFTELGGEAVIKTPHRVRDGYGLNERIVREALAEGAGLLVTCDNGIAAAAETALAESSGLPVVVTDHHEVPFTLENGEKVYHLPPAHAVVDPKRADCPYPYKGLCGAGVAYKLAALLYGRRGLEMPERFVVYTAIATVCDVMELTDENRILVAEGLRRLPGVASSGLQALMEATGLLGKEITAYHIGFVLGPCFNAAGRLASTEPAQRLLASRDRKEAVQLAARLKDLNEQRKAMTEEWTARAVELIESGDGGYTQDKVLVVTLPECHESIAGIIAGRLKSRYSRPVFVLTRTEGGYKGSGRSIEGYHMFDELSSRCGDILQRFGGHALAAGLTVPAEYREELRRRLNDDPPLTWEDLVPSVRIDLEMPTSYITKELVRELSLLEPFGHANDKPLFVRRNFRLRGASILGKNGNVLKLRVLGEDGDLKDALLFFGTEDFIDGIREAYGPEAWQHVLRREDNPVRADLVYYPSVNEYMGLETIQLTIEHWRFR